MPICKCTYVLYEAQKILNVDLFAFVLSPFRKILSRKIRVIQHSLKPF